MSSKPSERLVSPESDAIRVLARLVHDLAQQSTMRADAEYALALVNSILETGALPPPLVPTPPSPVSRSILTAFGRRYELVDPTAAP